MSINKPGVVELLTLFFSASPSYFCWADRRWILMPVWNFEIECFCLFVFVVFGFSLSITSITFRRNILCSYIYLMVCFSHAHLTQNMCVCENNVVRWNKWKKNWSIWSFSSCSRCMLILQDKIGFFAQLSCSKRICFVIGKYLLSSSRDNSGKICEKIYCRINVTRV